ncbi:MAG: hypothetical protein RL514_678 [Verrucomicrobiota bacterium]|jgi:hypothetical protein
MEFLKNHYEKLILGLTLLLLAAGAVVLVFQAGSVQAELDGYRKTIVESDGKRPAADDSKARRELLARVSRPPQTDFVNVHKVFNPDAWYVDTNGNLIAGTNVGVGRLVVQSITPQNLILWLESVGGTVGRESVKINAIRQFGRTVADQGKKQLSLSLTTTNAVNMLDNASKLQVFAREIGGSPDNPEVKLELIEPGKEPLKFTLSKAQGFTNVFEYIAFIVYPVESNFVWRAARKGQPLAFAGDTNIVVEITATNVVVRANSNDKATTVPLGPPPPAGARPK